MKINPPSLQESSELRWAKGGDFVKIEYLYAVIGLLGGALLAILFTTNVVNSNNTQMMRMMGMNQIDNQKSYSQGMDQMHEQMMGDEEMTMGGMVNELKGKTGDDFDKAFIEQMISHHQGAIDMAKLAQQYAKHDEMKNLADDIISAQAKEINQMHQWQSSWGY